MLTDFLVKTFVLHSEKIEEGAVRTRYGILSSAVGIICNLLLFGVKLTVGFVINSISVMADAFNNLSDAASSIIGFVGVKMAEKPADEDHPFGHGRIEYIAAFIVAFLVIEVGFSLFKTSVSKVIHPETITVQLVSVIILVLSVGLKLWMGLFNRKLGKRIQSKVMLATSADSLGDVAATSATILSLLIFYFFGWNLDGIVGVIVSIVVMIAGINIAKDTLTPLIGEAIDPKLYGEISNYVESFEGIVGTHDLIIHNYGPSRSMATIHAEVPNDVDIQISHEIIDQIEREACDRFHLSLVIHMDPVETKDQHILAFKEMVKEVLEELDFRLAFHDFRVIFKREQINLIFDLVVPRDYQYNQYDRVKTEINRRIQEKDRQCIGIITIENSYCAER